VVEDPGEDLVRFGQPGLALPQRVLGRLALCDVRQDTMCLLEGAIRVVSDASVEGDNAEGSVFVAHAKGGADFPFCFEAWKTFLERGHLLRVQELAE